MSVPLFHVAACNSQLIPMVQIGATTVVMPAFEVHRFLRAVPEERIRVVSTAPAIYWHALHHPRLADFDLSGVECATYGGAPMAPSLVRLIKQGFPKARVGNGFGLTETASLSTFLPDAWAVSHADSVGWPAPTVDVSLADSGELLIRVSVCGVCRTDLHLAEGDLPPEFTKDTEFNATQAQQVKDSGGDAITVKKEALPGAQERKKALGY